MAPRSRSESPVVITGMGIVSAVGNTVEDALEAALKGSSGIRRCDELLEDPTASELPVRVAGTVVDLDTSGLVADNRRELYSRGTVYALAAARDALDDAGLLEDPDARRQFGVVCGAAGTSADLYFETSRAIIDAGTATVMRSGHAPHLSSHAPSALVGLSFGLHGPNFAAAAACGTGNLTTIIAADQIRAGRAEAVLAGATESAVTIAVVASFVAARAVNPTDDPVGACRPFDRRRAGLVLGEGAAFLMLESEAHAERRGARPLARLLGDSLTNDAFHMWAPDPASWGDAISSAIERSGLRPDDITCVSAHAAGTPAGDKAETMALKQALGEHAYDVPIWSTKGVHGHAFAASGAMELVLSIAALRRGVGLPTVGLEEDDPDCDLGYLRDGASVDGSVLLKDSFGFMGTNAIQLLEVIR